MAGHSLSNVIARILWLAAGLLCRAQEPASFQGKVLDPMRAPLPGAQVSADGSTAVSNQDGEFVLKAAPGRYTLHIRASGFSEFSASITLPHDAGGLPEFVLQLAGHHDTVTITETADYQVPAISSGTKTPTPLRDLPQSVTVVTRELIDDQLMMSVGDVVRYVPGITAIQGENNRDQLVIRGNSTSADFFLNGVRDDVQYYRDLDNLDRVEALKGPNAMIFGRGGGGGVINRVTKEAGFTLPSRNHPGRRLLRE